MKNLVQLGETFGRLTVVGMLPSENGKGRRLCRCECGRVVEKFAVYLRNGDTKSCGCLNPDKTRETFTTHGKSQSRIYVVWSSMVKRCTNPTNSAYYKYGAKGISVADRWMKFENFLADMGEKPFPEAQIDRINNDGGR
jgi:hypothetical protein